jgi:sortase A
MRRALGTVLVVAGLLVLADVAVTLAWQEPLSALRAGRAQHRLAKELAREEARERGAGGADGAAGAPTRRDAAAGRAARSAPTGQAELARAARTYARSRRDGDAVAELRIPSIGLRAIVVRGTALADLREGPGLLDGAPLPGEHGTTVIAGHRTTYGAPFRRLDALRRDDPITVRLPYGSFRYAVEGTRVVDPGDRSVLRRVRHDRLVLSACHPLFSAARRIVVFARLVGIGQSASTIKRSV